MDRTLDSTQKAFDINLDQKVYGTFAEIGAGQEVARNFFRAGGAAGTIAKSMSAYDMTVSDDIYGKSGRYVSQERLETMLKREFLQLQERLSEQRGKDTTFFVFADTVAAKGYRSTAECHGWLGVRFQNTPCAAESEVVIHVTMLDQANLQQQEALGIVGTNLVYACFRHGANREDFISSLMDNMSTDRIKINMIKVNGSSFKTKDTRLWSLELVKQGFCEAVMFDQSGNPLQAKDVLYKKNIVVSRGSYRPPTLVNIDMLEKGTKTFCAQLKKEEKGQTLILPEISMSKLRERGQVSSEDFLARVELLNRLGYQVLISSYETYGQLSSYLGSCTNKQIAFVLGYYNLQEVFDHKKYCETSGALFGGLGSLLGQNNLLYVYPAKSENLKDLLTSSQAEVTEDLQALINYLEQYGRLYNLKDFDPEVLHIWSRTVIHMIQEKESGWEEMVPKLVAELVKKKCLFDYPCDT
jgi:hypothetical protein